MSDVEDELQEKMRAAEGNAKKHLISISSLYSKAQTLRSITQLLLTAGLLIASYIFGMAAMRYSTPAGMMASLLTAAFIVRLFMIQHDCGHRSFFRSHRINDMIGFWLGVVTMTPYRCWRRFHAQHHANSGNLDHRGLGDIDTLTTEEYDVLSPLLQRMYRLYRHPLILLVIGPPLLFMLRQRTTYKVPREWKVERRSVHLTNLGIIALGYALCTLFDPAAVLMYHATAMSAAAIAGVWLFYVQHQFPAAYWKPNAEWQSWRASMEGASYYELPGILRWVTANIGLHHIHHLDARIPNYRLYECYSNHREFSNPVRIGLRQSFACLNLRLWDARAERMVPFPARRRYSAAEHGA